MCMRFFVYEDYDQMSQAAARFVASQLLMKPNSNIGLTAGKTPAGMFRELIKFYQEGKVSFADAWFSNLEEVIGFGPDSPESYRSVFRDLLLGHVDSGPERMYLPNGLAEDIQAESARFDATLAGLPGGGLDMQILGIGTDGHIGLNRPGDSLLAASHPVDMSRGRKGIAMGMSSIMRAKCLLMLANGEDKAEAVANMYQAPVSTRCPATFLQIHPNVIVLLDRAAASKLSIKE